MHSLFIVIVFYSLREGIAIERADFRVALVLRVQNVRERRVKKSSLYSVLTLKPKESALFLPGAMLQCDDWYSTEQQKHACRACNT